MRRQANLVMLFMSLNVLQVLFSAAALVLCLMTLSASSGTGEAGANDVEDALIEEVAADTGISADAIHHHMRVVLVLNIVLMLIMLWAIMLAKQVLVYLKS